MTRPALALKPWLLAACLLASTAAASDTPGRGDLDAAFLLGDQPLTGGVPTRAFAPQTGETPSHRFEGRLKLDVASGQNGFEVLYDLFELEANAALQLDTLPAFDFAFVQQGDALIPLQRGPQAGDHPNWEYILEVGVVWDEAGDAGLSRAAIPFSLQERNANCTHNGLMTFLFNNDGAVSRVAWQIGSETCYYLQFNAWGVHAAHYAPGEVEGREAALERHNANRAARLPVKPMAALSKDFPGVDPAAFALHDPAEVSSYGLVVNGVHYAGGCPTRFGPHPLCAEVDLPSYSLAKSVFAGMMLMVLEQRYPGAGALKVTDHVPECRLADGRWEGVTLEHLVDMASGNFDATENQVDEFYSYTTAFVDADTHAGKIEASCTLFPRKAEPGSTFVYHSSDSYIAGTLVNAWLQDGGDYGDIHRDVLVPGVFAPLNLSAVTDSTRRTYDEVAQPFTGFGLTLLADDIARLALFLMQSEGRIDGVQVLGSALLDGALQRAPEDPGYAAGGEGIRYNNGFWAWDVAEAAGCEAPAWVPLMSGYGGISVALLPNGAVYYVFSDGGQFAWAGAAKESRKITDFCEAS